MHIEPEAIEHGQSLDKEGDLGIGFMTQPGSTHQDLIGQVQFSFLRKTLQESKDSCVSLADFLFSKSFSVSPAESSVTLPTPNTSCLPVLQIQGHAESQGIPLSVR